MTSTNRLLMHYTNNTDWNITTFLHLQPLNSDHQEVTKIFGVIVSEISSYRKLLCKFSCSQRIFICLSHPELKFNDLILCHLICLFFVISTLAQFPSLDRSNSLKRNKHKDSQQKLIFQIENIFGYFFNIILREFTL